MTGHPWSGQGDADLGRVQRSGADSQEHADITEGSGRTAESGHQRQALAATGVCDQSQLCHERRHHVSLNFVVAGDVQW